VNSAGNGCVNTHYPLSTPLETLYGSGKTVLIVQPYPPAIKPGGFFVALLSTMEDEMKQRWRSPQMRSPRTGGWGEDGETNANVAAWAALFVFAVLVGLMWLSAGAA